MEVGGHVVGGRGLDVDQSLGGTGRCQLREVAHAHAVDGYQGGGRAVGHGGGQGQQRVQAQRRGDLPGRGPHLGVQLRAGGDQHPRAASPQQPLDVFGRQARVHRGGDARGLRGQQGGWQLGGVRGEQTHGGSAGDAERAQQVGGAVHLVAQLRERRGGGAQEARGVGQHCQGRAVGPQTGGSQHRVVGGGGQAALMQRNGLDGRQVRGAVPGGPQQVGGCEGHRGAFAG
ncbi:hypothetical protein GCM10010260_73140 [Streptomyces filipinensis]|uniref:Uncharacterized protein n=1 Tax=Streptomyces filipinensis TaxID=66887 RepID=A0A918MFR1_9ACTN|nr:hypothetical protein GCM10010260_73140 [Streptomyces filipinensis]